MENFSSIFGISSQIFLGCSQTFKCLLKYILMLKNDWFDSERTKLHLLKEELIFNFLSFTLRPHNLFLLAHWKIYPLSLTFLSNLSNNRLKSFPIYLIKIFCLMVQLTLWLNWPLSLSLKSATNIKTLHE